jgi:hypothetical protein
MGATWTDTTVVKQLIKSGTPLTDAEINGWVDVIEGYYKLKLKIPDTFTFNTANKEQLLLRSAATLRTALMILSSQVDLSHRTIESAYYNYNGLYTQLVETDALLMEKGVRDCIVNGMD